MEFTKQEKLIAQKLDLLKKEAGSHSPSISTIKNNIPQLEVKVDACFLSNPYATELFLTYLKKELVETNALRNILEFYPSQNRFISKLLANHLGVNSKNILIGNGAIEIIQTLVHDFTSKSILINIPTFSPYYEFVRDGVEIIYNKLCPEEFFHLDIDRYIKLVKEKKPSTIVIINPNNPDGGYIKYNELKYIIEQLKFVENIIIDESFIHFAFENYDYKLNSIAELVEVFDNLTIVKSMSKDFGIAGIRAGYAIMSKERIDKILKNGYLWNSNGLAEYFFKLYVREDFLEKYEKVRVRYIKESQIFFKRLCEINEIKVYQSMANFVLVELLDGTISQDFLSYMLIKYGIYLRTGSDKIGLNGQFIRIASRTKSENILIVQSFKDYFSRR